MCASSETPLLLSFSSSYLRLITCYPNCLRYEAQHTATWKEPRTRGETVRNEEEEKEEKDGSLELHDGVSSDIRFYKERTGILEGHEAGGQR